MTFIISFMLVSYHGCYKQDTFKCFINTNLFHFHGSFLKYSHYHYFAKEQTEAQKD